MNLQESINTQVGATFATEAGYPQHGSVTLGTLFMGALVGTMIPQATFASNVEAFNTDPLFRKLVLDGFERAKGDPMMAGATPGADPTILCSVSTCGPNALKALRDAAKAAGYTVSGGSDRVPPWQERAIDTLCKLMVEAANKGLNNGWLQEIKEVCSKNTEGTLPENVVDLSTLLAAVGKAQPGSMVDGAEIKVAVKNGNPDPNGEIVSKRLYLGFRVDAFNIYRNGEEKSEGGKLVKQLHEVQAAGRKAIKEGKPVDSLKKQEASIKAQIRKLAGASDE